MTAPKHYHSASKGKIEISTMPIWHAENALAVLRRDHPKTRVDEIDALAAHVAKLSEEHAEQEAKP